MFEIGFWELVMIGVVALVVVGPARLPEVARNVGRFVGRARALARSVKTDISRELKAEELQQIMKKQAQIPELYDLIDEPVPEHHNPNAPPGSVPTSPRAHDPNVSA